MTDNEIKKALECCCTLNGVGCRNCPQYDIHSAMCVKNLIRNALDLINRQKIESNKYRNRVQPQKGEITRLHKKVEELTAEMEEQKAEIERMEKELIEYRLRLKMSECTVYEIKSEAIKEFAKRVKEKSIFISKGRINSENPMNYELDMEYRISMWDFDNLVKEITEVSE